MKKCIQRPKYFPKGLVSEIHFFFPRRTFNYYFFWKKEKKNLLIERSNLMIILLCIIYNIASSVSMVTFASLICCTVPSFTLFFQETRKKKKQSLFYIGCITREQLFHHFSLSATFQRPLKMSTVDDYLHPSNRRSFKKRLKYQIFKKITIKQNICFNFSSIL